MKLDVIKLDAKKSGTVDLDDAIFGLEPRADILHRLVRWQRAKAQAGTHATLGKSDVSYSTKKIYRQKGTGGARHGSRKAPIFRKGGVYKGPTPRSHAHDLTKKFRALGLKHALSAKASTGNLVILENLEMTEAKTSVLAKAAKELGWKRVLIIDGADVNENFVYEYDTDFKFVKKNALVGGHTHLGIQTATFADGHWYFGCYGRPNSDTAPSTPPILLKANATLKKVERFEFDCSLGIVPIGDGKLLVARGGTTKDKGHTGRLVLPSPTRKWTEGGGQVAEAT